jgi:hypothetical protein
LCDEITAGGGENRLVSFASSETRARGGKPVKSRAPCPVAGRQRRAAPPRRRAHDVWPLIAFDTVAFVAAAWLVSSVPESLEISAPLANAPITMAAYRAALGD